MSIVHVYPIGDLIEHDTDSDDCVCGPNPLQWVGADAQGPKALAATV